MWTDQVFRLAYRLAFPIVDRWWRFRKNHNGVIMAVWLDDLILAVRHSYKPGWRLPGGGVARGEDHRDTVVRELHEEVGIVVDRHQIRLFRSFDSAYGREYLYEVRVQTMPQLRIDHREIIEAGFLLPALIHIPDAYIEAYLGEATKQAVR